jgi:hypothetical protein
MHTYKYVFMQMYIRKQTNILKFMYIHVYILTSSFVISTMYMYLHIYIHIYIYIYKYKYIFMYMYIHAYEQMYTSSYVVSAVDAHPCIDEVDLLTTYIYVYLNLVSLYVSI